MANKIYENRVPRVYQWAWNTTKAGGIPIPVTHVLGMLEEMAGGKRLSVRTSRRSELDDVGCIAGKTQDALDLIIFRHLAVRDDGEPIKAHVVLQGASLGRADWRVARGSIINRRHAGFAREQKADLEKAREGMVDDADLFAAAVRVIMANREKYLGMSRLSRLDSLPDLSVDDSDRIHFDLTLEGHSVVRLRLEPR
jgi:hypothetical protein